ncbi:MAG: PorV/PorQ family protein [Bacteroidota bacterium]
MMQLNLTKMIRRSSLLAGICLMICTRNLHAQAVSQNVSKVGTTAATFLEIPVGSRAVSMGSAFVAVANDGSSLYWNPAGLARLTKREVLFAHSEWLADMNFDFAGITLPLGDFGSLGLSFASLTMEDMQVRTVERPEGTGEMFSAGSFAVGLHYSRNLSDKFSIGLTGKYISEHIWHMQSQAFAVDIGALFTTNFFNGLKVGAIISNFGSDLQLSGRDTRTFHPIDPNKLGSNDQIPQNLELDSWQLPLNFQFGISTNVVQSDEHVLTMAIDALHPSDNYESLNAGLEYGFEGTLFLRGGYRSLFLADHEGGTSFGVGIVASLFGSAGDARFDYSYTDYGRLKAVNVLTASVTF